MFHPTRDGCRGGRDQFKWDNLKNDKHRMNYLGNSVKAPHNSKWSNPLWYTSEDKATGAAAKLTPQELLKREIEEQKRRESELMNFYIAHGPGAKPPPELLERLQAPTPLEDTSKDTAEKPKEEKQAAKKDKKKSKHEKRDRSRSKDRISKKERDGRPRSRSRSPVDRRVDGHDHRSSRVRERYRDEDKYDRHRREYRKFRSRSPRRQ